MKVKGVIFDADGTLLDSMYIWAGVASSYLDSKGIEHDGTEDKIIQEMCITEAVAHCKKKYKLSDSPEQIIADICSFAKNEYFYNAKEKGDIKKLLEALRARGVKMCIATATDRQLISAALKRLSMLDYFSFIITCDEIGKSKSVPDVYRLALERLGTEKSETLVFEDAYYAANTAIKDGFKVIGVDDASCADYLPKEIKCDYRQAMLELCGSCYDDYTKVIKDLELL